MSKIRCKLFAACAACALLLSGCGGSSLNPFRIDVPQINIPQLPVLPTNPNRTTSQGTLSETRLHDMAGQNPVISNNTLTHNSPLGDVIELTVTGNNTAGSRYTLAKSGSGVPANYWTINDPQSGNVRSETDTATGRRGGANVTYDVYAVSRDEGNLRVGYTIFEDRSSTSDTDYLAGGFWTEVVLSGSNIQSYTGSGVFVSGEPYSGTLPSGLGTATYSGEAAGTYRRDNNVIGAFGGNVSFRVNFNGNNTSMNGSLTGVEGNDTGSNVDRLSGVQINFGSATNASGLYAGDVTCSGSCSGASGKWGGRFYGGAPASANETPDLFGGTFAVQNLNPSSGVADDVDMMGFFFTGKE